MNIGFTYNVRHVKPDPNNPQYLKEAEFDEPSTIDGIDQALRKLGHKIFHVEADEEAYLKFKELKNKIDLVFNIAEGMNGADREAQIPAMLEMLQIPYTGPKPLGYAVGLNKSVAKEILKSYGIPTAEWLTINSVEQIEKVDCKFFPALLKPLSEGSSKGIMARNLVNNSEELKVIAQELFDKFRQPIIAEEYLPGREFTVAVMGTPPRTLPIIEITFDDLPEGMPKFDHYEAKWIYDDPKEQFDMLVCPAKIDSQLEAQINDVVLRSFDALEMDDWARIDVRLDKDGIPNIIEVNCPPGIMPAAEQNSRYPRAARVGGLEYHEMIGEILKSACKRYNIVYHENIKTPEH